MNSNTSSPYLTQDSTLNPPKLYRNSTRAIGTERHISHRLCRMQTRVPSIDERKMSGERLGDAPLSPRHAFVVQFRADAANRRGRFAGRVEHMVSGNAARFSSEEQLTRFMRRVLRVVGAR